MDRDYIGACISCGQHFFKLRGGDEYKCARNSGAGYHWISDISWFMCLLFVVSGICARISLEKRNGRAFVRDRARRLLLPFLSYIVFIGPLDSGLSIRVNGIPEAFASLPEWVVFCIRQFREWGRPGSFCSCSFYPHVWRGSGKRTKKDAVRAGRKVYAAHIAASVLPGACLRPNPVYCLYLPRGFVSASLSYGILCFLTMKK